MHARVHHDITRYTMTISLKNEIITLIEQWGTGVRRIFSEAKDQGLPDPQIEEIGMRLRFTIYLKNPITAASGVESRPESQTTTPKTTQERLLELLKETPCIGRDELAQTLNITSDGVKYHLNRLREKKQIRHQGPSRGGYWEVLF